MSRQWPLRDPWPEPGSRRTTDALVDELRLTNQRYVPELLYERYGPGDVEVPEVDPGDLGVHFATMTHDIPAITDWLSGKLDG